VCCLLVLNLVSSTLPCICQPGPRSFLAQKEARNPARNSDYGEMELDEESGDAWQEQLSQDDDRPFIVLTETKFSLRCIPVWIGTLLTGLGSKKTHVIMFSP